MPYHIMQRILISYLIAQGFVPTAGLKGQGLEHRMS